MTSSTSCGRAREVTLNCSSNNGYEVEIGYYLHHMKKNGIALLNISKAFGWVSRRQICLKFASVPSSQGRGGDPSPLTKHDQKVLNEFSNRLRTVLDKAFDGKPVKKQKRQTIVFFVRVSFEGKEIYYRRVYKLTFNRFENIIQKIPKVRKALKRSIYVENSYYN